MFRRLILPIFAVVLLAFPVQAQQPGCGPYPIIKKTLSNKYGELPIARGLTASGKALELYFNPTKKTFTVVLTTPDGLACLVDGGESLELLAPKLDKNSSF